MTRLSSPMAVSAIASLAAGVIHAVAIGIYVDSRQASLVFVAIAIFQIGWAVTVLAAPLTRTARVTVVAAGAVGNAALVVGWFMATGGGVSFIDGLEVSHGVTTSDAVAAALATMSTLAAAIGLVGERAAARRHVSPRPVGALSAGLIVGVIGIVAVPGLVAASDHAAHDHGEVVVAADGTVVDDDEHDHSPAVSTNDTGTVFEVVPLVETAPYHPDLPINLGGMPGVSPEQQARAENLVAVSLARLPQYMDPADAVADGYYSFGDGVTGHEHYLNWDLIDDGHILDPDYPESLVYATRDGKKTLVSAMFMLDSADTLETVPDVGGELMQWHVHQDICMTTGDRPTLAGIRSIGGACGSGVGFPLIPMIHVWIEPNECGPFAALKGIGAGQVTEGEDTLCDHAHGH